MSGRVLAAVFAATFGVFLIAGLPLAVVARTATVSSGLSFDHASGTVWSGTLHNVEFGGRHLGELRLGLEPLYLGLARLRADFAFNGRHGSGNGIIEAGFGFYLALKDATLNLTVENFGVGLALDGMLSLNAVTLVLDGGNCRSAEGALSTDVLARNAATLGREGPLLAGNMECRDGVLRLPLSGASGTETVDVETLIFADRRYEARVAVTTEDQRLAQILSAVGFSNDAGVLALEQAGRWADDQFDMLSAGG